MLEDSFLIGLGDCLELYIKLQKSKRNYVRAILILLFIILCQSQSPCKLVMYILAWMVGAVKPIATTRAMFSPIDT